MSRLSDEELVEMLAMNQGNGDAYATRDEIRNVVSELRERREPRSACRGNIHVFHGGYSRDCMCRRMTERR